MTPTKIENEELLYRAVRAGGEEFTHSCGTLQISASAFNDRYHKPSVDRSSLRKNPEDVKRSQDDEIAQLLTEEVRAITSIKIDPNNKESLSYGVDALHNPVMTDPINVAHSQIQCDPEIANKSRFKKLKEALARLATKRGFVAAQPPIANADAETGEDRPAL